MKKEYVILTGAFALFYLFRVNAQISEGGMPPSFYYQGFSTKSYTETINQIPIKFNVEDMKLVDAWQVSEGAPLKIATILDVNYSMENSGEWKTLPDGEQIWQLQIAAEGAIALMFYYKNFYIPEGGKLFIYNEDKSQILGAYTNETNPEGGRFATEFIEGDRVTFEYLAVEGGDKPSIEIEEVGYGYNHLYITKRPSLRSESAFCEVNINCEEGEEWQDEKAGVCKILQRIGDYTYQCSGSLVNNTAQDFKPYILSATHCLSSSTTTASEEDMKQWVFYFHYETNSCTNPLDVKTAKTMVGCKKIVDTPTANGGSDGLLLLLNNKIPADYKVYYNGWNISNTPALSGVSIHHPKGDYKKISTFDTPVKHTTWKNTSKSIESTHWNATFSPTSNGFGVTEGGSSGSPIFNQNKLIIGTLTGGNSSCNNSTGTNVYGKMYSHWNSNDTDKTKRMDVWLDPLNSGAITLKGRYDDNSGNATGNAFVENESIRITPTQFADYISIQGYQKVKVLDIYSSEGRLIKTYRNPGTTILTNMLPQGIYFFRLTTETDIKTIKGTKY